MPSRKVISLLIICISLVTSIILASGKGRGLAQAVEESGFLSKGAEVNIPKNDRWLAELTPHALSTTQTAATSSSGNLTQEVSQSLFANYLSLRQSGNLNNASAENLINQALAYAETSSQSGKIYTTADIVVSADKSQAAVRAYGADLGNAFKINRPAQVKNEIQVFSEILQTQDRNRVQELKDISETYRRLTATIKNIKTPSSYVGLHLEMLNDLGKIAASVEDMALVFEDPLRSMQGIGSYQAGYLGLMGTLNKIRMKILKEDKVVYKQGESGYYLYYGL